MKENLGIESECIRHLHEIPYLDVRIAGDEQSGFDVEIFLREEPCSRLNLEIKVVPSTRVILPHFHCGRWNTTLVICTKYVNKKQAADLRKEGVLFLDTVGNMFIKGKGIYLYVAGNTPRERTGMGRPTRVFQRAGLRLIWALLRNHQTLNKPLREIASQAGIAHGAIDRQLHDLDRMGFIRSLTRSQRVLDNEPRLLERWLQGYVERLRPHLLVGNYKTNGDMQELLKRIKYLPEVFQPIVGGELAASIMHPKLLVPGTATLHILPQQEKNLQELCRELRLAPTNRDPNVFLVRPLGEAKYRDDATMAYIADPVQILGELTIHDTRRLDEMRAALMTDILKNENHDA